MKATVVVWVAEATWLACVDAARTWAPRDATFILLHVAGSEISAAHGALAGLLGRGGSRDTADRRIEALAEAAATELLDQAARRLAAPAEKRHLQARRVEHAVVEEADAADLLVCARDGDRSRLGPRSLGPATRFVVDHAPCPVLLVWPEPAPDIGSIPPPPPPGHAPPPPPR